MSVTNAGVNIDFGGKVSMANKILNKTTAAGNDDVINNTHLGSMRNNGFIN
jgi:hypothetical protein